MSSADTTVSTDTNATASTIVSTDTNTTANDTPPLSRLTQELLRNWALERTKAEIRERFGVPRIVRKDAYDNEWVYFDIPVLDPESGATAQAVTFQFKYDPSRGQEVVNAIPIQ